MKKLVLLTIVSMVLLAERATAQNIIIQQNNQTNQSEPKIVEKKIYVEKPVYIEKTNPKPTSPVCIMGYLYVFPETFSGTVDDIKGIIRELNNNNAHGFSTWRLPTMPELQVLYSNKNSLPGIMDDQHGYISSEYIRTYNGNYPLHRMFDPSGKHWSVEPEAGMAGTAILVHK